MYALFEDGGKFLAGRLMSEADSSMQVELDSGKRVKVKAANVLLRFSAPTPGALLEGAAALATELDPSFLWDVSGEEEKLVRKLQEVQERPPAARAVS